MQLATLKRAGRRPRLGGDLQQPGRGARRGPGGARDRHAACAVVLADLDLPARLGRDTGRGGSRPSTRRRDGYPGVLRAELLAPAGVRAGADARRLAGPPALHSAERGEDGQDRALQARPSRGRRSRGARPADGRRGPAISAMDIWGGCCGTCETHLDEIARSVAEVARRCRHEHRRLDHGSTWRPCAPTPPPAPGMIHANNAGASPTPDPVHQAVVAHLELERRIGGYAAAEAAAAATRRLLRRACGAPRRRAGRDRLRRERHPRLGHGLLRAAAGTGRPHPDPRIGIRLEPARDAAARAPARDRDRPGALGRHPGRSTSRRWRL